MKKLFIFISFAIIVWVSFTTFNRYKPGPLLDVKEELRKSVEFTYKTGKNRQVYLNNPEKDVIIISPPYHPIKGDIETLVSKELISFIQDETARIETGHLYCISKDKIIDHRILTGLAEPVFGYSQNENVKFLISRKNTSGRPVRIEIID
jgi:hypothetical protein